MHTDKMLVTAEWLLEHLNDPDIRTLDIRSPMEYMSGHLPNAVLIPYERIVDFSPGRPYFDVAPKERIEELLSEKGVSNDTTVVVYGDRGGASAARLYWTLELYGADVKLLDITFTTWRARGLPVTRDVPRPEPSKFVAKESESDSRATSKYVASKIKSPDTVLLDTRTHEEHSGMVASGPRAGRIPSSINIPWDEAVGGMEKIFKERNELEKLFEERGLTKEKEVVCYCQVGERASHTFLALRLLGYPKVKIYDRSFSEWSSLSELPVEV